MNPTTGKKIIVGLSGGVDSAVAAMLLQQQGHTVEALFMKNWDDDDDTDYCPAEEDLKDATSVANKLGIKLHTVSFSAEYWDRVFAHFLAEYEAGRTPNPDILCNQEIKFKAFLDYALELGADAIATGHYARHKFTGHEYQLLKGKDQDKDQSYFLYRLTQRALQHCYFPLGDLEKSHVRALARQAGFVNSGKKDSTGICFIGERKFTSFLSRYLSPFPGKIISTDGEDVGQHQGLMFHTIGQRQGLGIGGRKSASGDPWYVSDKNLATNTLIVAQGSQHPSLFKSTLTANDVHWIGAAPTFPLHCHARIRYRQAIQSCLVESAGEQLTVNFEEPQRAITPGQALVLYSDDTCLGGGTIL